MTPWFWERFHCGLWVVGENSAISPLESASAQTEEEIPQGAKVTEPPVAQAHP